MDKEKNCLNCFYEPKWGDYVGYGEYIRRYGRCQWPSTIPVLPSIYTVSKQNVVRYDDDSGVEVSCKAWCPK